MRAQALYHAFTPRTHLLDLALRAAGDAVEHDPAGLVAHARVGGRVQAQVRGARRAAAVKHSLHSGWTSERERRGRGATQ